MSKIKNITVREIQDSRGNSTIEVELETGKGNFIASVPSGASTGKNEALELRDKDGKGVQKAIENINKIIAPKLKGKDVVNQKGIDELMVELDGTENKSKLGANAILAVSMAVCRAGAAAEKLPLYEYISELMDVRRPTAVGRLTSHRLPLAMFNILEGGVHSKNDLDIQEFMVVPQKKTFAENLVLCSKIFQNLKDILIKNYGSEIKIGDEGGFAPQISKTEQALYLLKNAIEKADVPMALPSRIHDGSAVGTKIALDCAASQFYQDGKYKIEGRELTRTELLNFYQSLVDAFPIILIEDPFAEDDWQGFESIVRLLCDKIMIVGDDLTTTNIKRIKEAHSRNACNAIIIKPNQIGTVSEAITAANLAKSFGWKIIVSHRSGETMDDFIADLAVGIGADFIKAGSPAKEERMVKYNRLLEIEKELK